MKDWKLIFNTNSYHYILIKEEIKEKYLKFYFQFENDIKTIDSYFFLLPERNEAENDKNILSKYAPLLKSFMEDPNKKTLFTEENILKTLVKEDKLNNFFRYIAKNNKNIVLFYYGDMDKYINIPNTSKIIIKEQELYLQSNLLERFDDIKTAIDNTFNPFKDPVTAFNKIQKED